ncbi:hypothetical protein GCM10023166_24840 [Paeniglutamicibacter cryotolerans]
MRRPPAGRLPRAYEAMSVAARVPNYFNELDLHKTSRFEYSRQREVTYGDPMVRVCAEFIGVFFILIPALWTDTTTV